MSRKYDQASTTRSDIFTKLARESVFRRAGNSQASQFVAGDVHERCGHSYDRRYPGPRYWLTVADARILSAPSYILHFGNIRIARWCRISAMFTNIGHSPSPSYIKTDKVGDHTKRQLRNDLLADYDSVIMICNRIKSNYDANGYEKTIKFIIVFWKLFSDRKRHGKSTI